MNRLFLILVLLVWCSRGFAADKSRGLSLGLAPIGMDGTKEHLAAGAFLDYEMKYGFTIGVSASWRDGMEKNHVPILKLYSGDVQIPVPFTKGEYKLGFGYGQLQTRLDRTDGDYEYKSVFLRVYPNKLTYIDAVRIGRIVKSKEGNIKPLYQPRDHLTIYLFLLGVNFW